MIISHLIEIRYRLIYTLISWMISLVIWLTAIPELLKWAPFSFINYQWDETIMTLLKLSAIAATLTSIPLIIWNLYQFLKPALMEGEHIWIVVLSIWTSIILEICLITTPYLLFKLPYFINTFQSDNWVLLPRFSGLSGIITEMVIGYLIIWLIPISIYLGITRTGLYMISLFIITIFIDSIACIVISIPIIVIIEISFFSIILLRKIIRKKE